MTQPELTQLDVLLLLVSGIGLLAVGYVLGMILDWVSRDY